MEQQLLFDVPGVAVGRRSRPVAPPAPAAPGDFGIAGRNPGRIPGLDDAQSAVVNHRGGPLLVLAGPGTGRSAALVAAVAARLHPGPGQLPGERVLVLTAGGRRAATELREAIASQPGVPGLPLVTTFHAFAHWVLRGQGEHSGSPLRLLTAPEQEARLRELLSGAVSAGRLAWPEELLPALGTRGIGPEVRALLARARGLGLDGPGLTGLGRRAGVPAWQAIGSFLDEYLDTLDLEGVIDYSELMFRVMVLAHRRRDGAALRSRYDLIVVDEYQDVEPVGVALLQALASQGADLIVAGDPDMALYGFRGAQHGAVARFPARFVGPTGQPAPIVVLSEQHRIDPAILAIAQRVLAPVTLAPLPAAVQVAHRAGPSEPASGAQHLQQAARDPHYGPSAPQDLVPGGPTPRGGVAVEVYPSLREQATGIADRLVRAHAQGLRWQDMAVVVRNPGEQLELLRAGLAAAGIPAHLRAGEPPLSRQPAVAILSQLLAAAIGRVRGEAGGAGPAWDPHALLSSPVGAADPLAVQLLSRALAGPLAGCDRETGRTASRTFLGVEAAGLDSALRAGLSHRTGDHERFPNPLSESAQSPTRSLGESARPLDRSLSERSESKGACSAPACPPFSGGPACTQPADPLRWAVQDPQGCVSLISAPALWSVPQLAALREALDAVARVDTVVAAAAGCITAGSRPQEVLWALWSGSDWPARLRQEALAGGPGAVRAHSALDAVMELFDLAGRLPANVRGLPGALTLHAELSAQDVPVQLRAGAQRHPDAVTVCSVHQSRGSSWPLAVIAGVQEGRWPDLRRRANLLSSDELGATGRVDPPGAADRLVAERRLMYVACTRASSQLIVTAVADPAAGLTPSRFVSELGVEVVERQSAPAQAASALGVVSRLRALLGHEDELVRQGAADRLARLSGLSAHSGAPLIPGANPEGWWFARPVSGASAEMAASVVEPQEVRLSASMLAGLQECPLRWFLQRRAGAAVPTTAAMSLGRLIHNLADQLAQSGPLVAQEQVAARIADLQVQADQAWGDLPCASGRESAVLRARANRMISTLVNWHRRNGRQPVASEWGFDVGIVTPSGPVRLVGAVDRIDLDGAGGLHVVDFKTSRTPVSKSAAAADPQLAVYQLALGASQPGLAGGPVVGAELVYLDRPTAAGLPTVRTQDPVAPGGWAVDLIGRAGQMLREQRFPALPGAACLRCRFTDICPASKEPDDECDQ